MVFVRIKKTMRRFRFPRLGPVGLLLFFLWLAVSFYFSHQPGQDRPLPFPHFDKLVHFVWYGAGGLFLGLLRLTPSPSAANERGAEVPFWRVLEIGLWLALFDEAHQFFIPGRSPDILDMIADMAGFLLLNRLIRRPRLRQILRL